ncbi:LamG-like jellyroll fold domain-containing protein [Kitasatospora sp. NPDC097643]|uniref:LamG-like jellyroll fold domain-containing protein n=1 Tax=Kitasatospora sp. NPDC097643 TaxID=3157230 RepID=UPI00331B53C3
MSDRPVPSGEPGQPSATPPQQAPAGGAVPAPGVPPQPSPSGAFGPAAAEFGPPPGVAPQPGQPQPGQVTPRPVSQPVPLLPPPGQPGQPVSGQPVPPVGPVQPAPGQPQPQPVPGQPAPGQPVPGQALPQPAQPQPGQAIPGQPLPGQPAPQPGQPAQQWQQPGFPPPSSSAPDWEALAEQNEQQAKKRRRLKLIGAVTAVVVVAAAGAGVLLMKRGSDDNKTPVADSSASQSQTPGTPSGSGSPSGGGSATPSGPPQTNDSPPTVGTLPATKGTAALGLGSDAKPGTLAGYNGQVLKLASGQNSFAQTTSQIVDTNKSFTVSIRVNVDLPNGNRSALSQGDGQYYAYSLGRTNNDGHNLWYFKVQLPGGGSAVAYSKGDATVNQWVLLTGVYDAAGGQITLYVNGAPQSSAKAAGVRASGANTLQIGRLSSNAQWSDPWHGAVADVQTWDQVLPEADIVKTVAGPSSPPSIPPTAAWLTGG